MGDKMKILILKDCNVGKKDELITVKDGYGKNFIINKGLGVLATEDLILKRNERIALKNKEIEESIKKSEDLKIEIEDTFLIIRRDFNGDKMFGSIGNKEVSEELAKIDISVPKKNIKMSKIYTIGSYTIAINCGNSIKAELNIEVEAN
jgi:large subunit ribosomal protein L9